MSLHIYFVVAIVLSAVAAVSSEQLILVVGGGIQNDVLPTSDAELIDLDNPSATCVKPDDFPSTSGIAMAVGITYKEKATLCGGGVAGSSTPDCYSFNSTTRSWLPSSNSLVVARQQAATTQVGTIAVVSGGVQVISSSSCDSKSQYLAFQLSDNATTCH
jgi:hypothetical protein